MGSFKILICEPKEILEYFFPSNYTHIDRLLKSVFPNREDASEIALRLAVSFNV